jgi:hypothetical protein
MGEVPAVLALIRGKGMTDADILTIINPPASARDRSAFITSRHLPGHAEWRNTSIGATLDMNTHVIRSNHFRVDASRLVGMPINMYLAVMLFASND